GMLGEPGVLALSMGAVLTVSGLGGRVALAVITTLLLVAIGVAAVALSVTKRLAVQRRRVRAGPEGLIGHLGVVRSWAEPTGSVLMNGALWRARRSIVDEKGIELHASDRVVVEHLTGLTVGVRRAEE